MQGWVGGAGNHSSESLFLMGHTMLTKIGLREEGFILAHGLKVCGKRGMVVRGTLGSWSDVFATRKQSGRQVPMLCSLFFAFSPEPQIKCGGAIQIQNGFPKLS